MLLFILEIDGTEVLIKYKALSSEVNVILVVFVVIYLGFPILKFVSILQPGGKVG